MTTEELPIEELSDQVSDIVCSNNSGALEIFLDENSGIAPEILSWALTAAAERGNVECLNVLLNKGARPSHYENEDPLVVACRYGHLNIVKALLARRWNTEVHDGRALKYACGGGFHDIAKELLNAGADTKENWKAIRRASASNDLYLLRVFVDKGVDLGESEVDFLCTFATRGNLSGVAYILSRNPNCNKDLALVGACQNGNLEIVRYFLEHGADPKARLGEARVAASKAGRNDIVDLIQSFY